LLPTPNLTTLYSALYETYKYFRDIFLGKPTSNNGPLGQIYKKESMESVILHYKAITDIEFGQNKLTYSSVEAPKGEFGCLICTQQTNWIRLKIRAPGFFHLQPLTCFCKNTQLSDVITIIGTLDLVLGEVDRIIN
jgi:NADH:ubiquinone oxidoreductase subunit D